MKKPSKKISKFLTIGFLLFSCYCIVRIVVLRSDYNHRQATFNSITSKCEAVEAENYQLAEIEKLLKSGNNDEYIERLAREKFHYVYPGERVYVNKSVVK